MKALSRWDVTPRDVHHQTSKPAAAVTHSASTKVQPAALLCFRSFLRLRPRCAVWRWQLCGGVPGV